MWPFFHSWRRTARRASSRPPAVARWRSGRWRDPCNLFESHYGLGTMLSAPGPREWMGHTGSLQGFLSRTARHPALDLTVTVLTNAQDGLSIEWVEGIASTLFAFQQHGAPGKKEPPGRGAGGACGRQRPGAHGQGN